MEDREFTLILVGLIIGAVIMVGMWSSRIDTSIHTGFYVHQGKAYKITAIEQEPS